MSPAFCRCRHEHLSHLGEGHNGRCGQLMFIQGQFQQCGCPEYRKTQGGQQ